MSEDPNESQKPSSSNFKLKKPGCLGTIVFVVGSIFVLGMVFYAICPYKIRCESNGKLAVSAYFDKTSADLDYAKNTASGLSCTKEYTD